LTLGFDTCRNGVEALDNPTRASAVLPAICVRSAAPGEGGPGNHFGSFLANGLVEC